MNISYQVIKHFCVCCLLTLLFACGNSGSDNGTSENASGSTGTTSTTGSTNTDSSSSSSSSNSSGSSGSGSSGSGSSGSGSSGSGSSGSGSSGSGTVKPTPVISGVTDGKITLNVADGADFSYMVKATVSNSAAITYGLSGQDEADFTLEPSKGELKLKKTANHSVKSQY